MQRSTIDLVDDFLSVGLFHPIHLSEFTLAYTVFRASNNESEVEFQLEYVHCLCCECSDIFCIFFFFTPML
jgi:hypothetical protein